MRVAGPGMMLALLLVASLVFASPPAAPAATPAETDPGGSSPAAAGLAGATATLPDGRLRVLVDYAAPPTLAERAALEDLGARVLYEVRVVPVLVVAAPPAVVPRLGEAPGVVAVEPDRPLWPALDKSRVLIRAHIVPRDLGATGAGVTIAVLDTGVDPSHPDLRPKTLAGHDASAPVTLPGSIGGQATPVLPGDSEGHGTHVAGIALGPGTFGRNQYPGIAEGAGLVNVKVFDPTGEASSSYVLAGIDWVLDRRDQLNIRVMQMSLGGRPTDGTDALSRAIDVATTRGLLTVAAAGNDGPDPRTVGLPGVARTALTVGAVDDRLTIAAFSARGPTVDGREKPDLVAPGVAITSTLPLLLAADGYGDLSGTSMASPHAAGVAAMMWQANASLSPAEVKAILVATARPLAEPADAWDPAYGWGLLDAETAVRAALDPSVLPGLDRVLRQLPREEVGLLDQIGFEVDKARRAVPGPDALVAVAAGALLAFATRRRGGR